MTIDDFEIEIKKIQEHQVIVNVTVCGAIELRGFVIRKSKYGGPWISPPSVQAKNGKYFWQVVFKDNLLWQAIKKKILDSIGDTANLKEPTESLSELEIDRISEEIT